MNNFSSRKRPRSCRRSIWSLSIEHQEGTTPKDSNVSFMGRKRGHAAKTYQSAFCISVLLVQLARVHSWSPSFSSSIAKKFTPSTSNNILAPRDSDALFWASFADRPAIPSSELISSRYLIHDAKNLNSNSNSNNLLRMSASSSSGSPPSMLLRDDFFFPASSKTLAASECDRRGVDGGNSLQSSESSVLIKREGRVLGFDVFELHAKRSESSSGEELSNDPEAFYLAPGLTWQNSPLPNTANDNLAAAAAAASPAAIIQPKGRSNNNGGVRLLRYSSPLLPAWFPWVPTKSQIMTLKLKELKEACSQRGLTKVGSYLVAL